ncbi:MAG: type I methionyl aminopeptidase [Chloroflexota bacterium]|nr:MAG: type I methionyl aminopeptidase [Chloroflexota bacterium]
MAIILKSAREIAAMRKAGIIVATVLAEIEIAVRPGITTKAIDEIAERIVSGHDARASFKGLYGFPASICISINEEVVHGIPSPERVLREGDIVSLDFGAIVDEFNADAAVSLPVGAVGEPARRILQCGRTALQRGIAQARDGNRLGDISWAIQSYGEAKGYGIVRQYVGHGIGRKLHEDPQVPNFGPPARSVALRPGMTLAIEPMLNGGTERTTVLADNWTVVTEDRALSVHFEHTIAITEGDPVILTAPE